MRTAAYTCLALTAFAANSVLCRLALSGGSIDPASFATVRIASGAATLLLIASSKTDGSASRRSWGSAAAMFLYVVPFSFAYTGLTAGTGALILFGPCN